MSEIKVLTKKRSSIVRRIEVLYDKATAASLDNASEKTKKDFLMRYDTLFEDIAKFESFHLDIIGLIEDSEIEKQEKIQDSFNDMQFAIKSIYKDLCDTQTNVKADTSSLGHHSSKSDKCDRVRLPRIEIHKFDGDIKKWPTFFDLFRTLIHESSSLTNIERFQFLVSYLEDEAALVIKNIPITEANYETAYNALVKRYQNERVLLTSYWLAVYQAPNVKSKSPVELRKLLSVFSENLAALDLFKIDLWNFTKFNLLLQKLDGSLKTAFEIEFSDKIYPQYDDLFNFLQKQCRAMENSQLLPKSDVINVSNRGNPNEKSNKGVHSKANPHNKFNDCRKTYSFYSGANNNAKCAFCKQSSHSLIKCDGFLCAETHVRYSFVKKNRLCFNCLASGHSLDKCESQFSCRVCQKRHHTLLHFPNKSEPSPMVSDGPTNENPNEDKILKVFSSNVTDSKGVLFATARVSVLDNSGRPVQCRALLDSASQTSFISELCLKRLNIVPRPSTTSIQGVNQMSMCASLGEVSIKLSPFGKASPIFDVNAIVLSRICDTIPISAFRCQKWKYLRDLNLADPDFNSPSEIDILLGVDVFSEIVLPGLHKGKNGGPSALNTSLGWILFGSVESCPVDKVLSCFSSLSNPLDDNLKRFWELESIPQSKILSRDEIMCEEIFSNTCDRDKFGRYVVQLPFRSFPPTFGDSRSQALHRFVLLEKRLNKKCDLKSLYSYFMQDYIDQGHMTLVNDLASPNEGYFIPHHCVLKGDGDEKKIRVVFDGSATSSNGKSLNDCLFTGPKLQNEIAAILLNFRIFTIVFTADIRQMYRQIVVAKEHRDFQRILWRNSSSEPVHEYQLNTVTYGLSSSPYLAIRCLLQLADDYNTTYPLAAELIKRSTYVDDVMGGAFSVDESLTLQKQLIELLSHGCFELRKWSSNHPDLLKSIPESHQQIISFSDKETTGLKVLGLQWSPTSDCFSFCVRPNSKSCTKRTILSEISRIYDPLGFLSPTILVAKHLIQKLWLQGLKWDEIPPSDILHQWEVYCAQLHHLSSISIPRRLILDETMHVELHGFCDASEVGFASVIYSRQIVSKEKVIVSLVCAKNRVSPLKRISLPRLELCAASLLAECVEFVMTNVLNIKVHKVYAWSDSAVTLAWIRASPHRWKTFVANRVAQIQDRVPPECWRHVDGRHNPADCASRGILPEQLVSHPLWWAGPAWLQRPSEFLDRVQFEENIPEEVAKEERKINVGGRLRNPDIAYDAKHPILLPRNHRVTELIINQFHNDNLHPGPRTLSYLISQQFWILSARRAIHHVLSKCYRCFRINPPCLTPFMGDLPPARVAQVKAFTHTGVDFAGPLSIVLGRSRGVRGHKAYICVFVCLGTKALHLEAVSDLTSEAFLAALRRFVARRGKCTDLYGDCGTNFVGANNLLGKYCREASEELSIKWHFNPPAAPHWGGIWESAVRSVKKHLVRVVGLQILTFEELSTFLAQVEAVLNSRPLCSMSPDPNDLASLTPGHFLTTEPLTAPPDENLLDESLSRLRRWQLVQQLHQQFWKRWQIEYLHSLQHRAKWNSPQNPPKVGILVVLKDNNTPPLRWLLGRITKLYQSPDKVARIAQVRTSKGLVDRPLVKLCPLPDQ